ncbi:MAG TPA: SEC-C metal-binding domain-containing protein, partial [Dehalococcoidia bacterium]|nr:SEC-C metal-binding domain-containing protein [Dehalococcoidia bacterium]
AVTEAEEFAKIYNLDVVVIPTHKEMIREDYSDLVFRNERAKFNAVAQEIEECYQDGQPVLVGTVSIEKSEYLSELLKRRGIPHEVLNAKHHEREAQIIARAGERGAVTIATNMAGRGTDIKLGEGVDELGGLHVVGTERHEARRIDNQLRGRSGRQGDPGSSRFYVSFEDDIMRKFAPDWLPGMMARLGMEEDMPLESGWVSRAIETAQTKVEGHHFDIRKRLVEYDDVMNLHRETVYAERRKVLEGADIRANVLAMVHEELDAILDQHLQGDPDEWDLLALVRDLSSVIPLEDDATQDLEGATAQEIATSVHAHADERYAERESELGAEAMRTLERLTMLRTIDQLWVHHLTEMDEMRQGIGLRAYGQGDPLVHYKREAHDMYQQLTENIRSHVARSIFRVQLVPARTARAPVATTEGRGAEPQPDGTGAPEGAPAAPPAQRAPVAAGVGAAMSRGPTAVRTNRDAAPSATPSFGKVGRNEPCPCGSGLKYKKCHGASA